MEEVQTQLFTLSKDVEVLKAQIAQFETSREIDAKFSSLREGLARIEADTNRIQARLEDMNARMSTSEQDGVRRDNEQRESQYQLQIRTLYSILGFIVTIIGSIVVAYYAHWIN